jgi:hypothetical protein
VSELASRLRAQPTEDLSLAVGAVALGIGAVLANTRMQEPWAAFPLLLLLAVPCAALFILAFAPRSGGQQVGTRPDGRLAPWQTACLLVAIPLLALSIIQLVVVLGEDNPGTGTETWVLVLTGISAALISIRLQSPGGTLLAALFFGAAALTAINWIDSNAKLATYRDVLLIEGAVFLLAARSQWDSRRADAKLLVGVAGASLIAGAVLGNVGNPFGAILGIDAEGTGGNKDGWELVLIVVSIGLLAFGAWQRHGPTAVVGGAGLYAFFTFTQDGSLSGWPLVLGLVTLACLVWALVVRPSREAPGAGAPPPTPQPPPAQPPPT